MTGLMSDLENFRAYIDDLLTISKDLFRDHIAKLEKGFYINCIKPV